MRWRIPPIFLTVVLAVTVAVPQAWGDVTAKRAEAASRGAEDGTREVHRYRMAGKIRPLLLFWIGRDNVGSARLAWEREGDELHAIELLIGSDPARAPRQVNRWGYIREEVAGPVAVVTGLVGRTDEQSLDEAEASVEDGGAGGYLFRMLEARVDRVRSTATLRTINSRHDYTYHELDALERALDGPSAKVETKSAPRPDQARPGMLAALHELVADSLMRYRRDPANVQRGARRQLEYIYNVTVYDLTLERTRVRREARYGGRAYTNLLESEFEVHNQKTGNRESFTIVYGTEGAHTAVPVFLEYQPRWWLKVELVLDEDQDI